MALTEQQVIDLYAAIVRREPNAHELSTGQNSTESALTNTLIGQASADVFPFIYIYQAAFNRIPDADGLDYWVNEARGSDLDLWDFSAKFADSNEWADQFDDIPNQAIVVQLYQNILGRPGDAAGIQYWTNALNTGAKTVTDLLYDFALSDEHVAKNQEAAENLLREVGAGTAELDGSVPLSNFDTPTAPSTHQLTTDIDTVVLKAGDSVAGAVTGNPFTDTYTAGDAITGVKDGNNLFVLSLGGFSAATDVSVNNVDNVEINVNTSADTSLVVENWNGIKNVAINKAKSDVTLVDIQNGGTWFNINDQAWSEGHAIVLDYDGNESTNVANIGVKEVYGTIKAKKLDVNGGKIETINLRINDENADGKESVLVDLEGQGTKTLNITGGNAGRAFTITNALDSTLTKLDASAVLGDLRLDTSETFTKLEALLGKGNDVLKTGDTLGTGDVYDGGEGVDRIVVDFATTDDPNRTPTIRNVEVLEASFQSAVQLWGTNIDKSLATIDLNKSAARADFNNFNSGLKTVNVNGVLAQGLEVDYDGKEFAALTVNVEADVGNAGNKAALRVINADEVTVDFLAKSTLNAGIQVDDDFSGRYTEKLTIANKSGGAAVVGNHFGTAVVDGNTIKDFTVKTYNHGSLTVGDASYAALAEADKLQHLTVESAENSNIKLGLIGGSDPADDLETVVFNAADFSTIRSWGIDADDSWGLGNSAATVTSIDITGGRNARIELNGNSTYLPASRFNETSNIKLFGATVNTSGENWLQAASIGVLNVNTHAQQGGVVQGAVTEVARVGGSKVSEFKNLIGLDLESASNGVINVSGSGKVNGFWFEDEVVSTINASGLTGKSGAHFINANGFDAYFGSDVADAVGLTSSITYDFAVLTTTNASSGFTFEGSAGNDYVVGTHSNDVLRGGAGQDFLIGNGGDDIIEGGVGNDILVGDSLEATLGGGALLALDIQGSYPSKGAGTGTYAVGNDIINGGAGDDIIIGGGQRAGGRDILTGGEGKDKFVFNFDKQHTGAESESGKSTLQGDSVYNDIITDFTTGQDLLVIDVTKAPKDFAIAVYGGDSTAGWNVVGDIGDGITVIVRRGNYNDFDGIDGGGTFQASRTGDDLQVLFLNEADDFTASLLDLAGDGQNFYNQADHEIALLNAAQHSGSLALSDILFV